MELDEVKGFLKVDFDDDDNYISLLIDAAREYVVDALGKCDENIARVKLLMMVIITELYENRSFTVDTANQKAQYTIRSIINQLQNGDDDDS
ncbi:MAG: head-tail connector protein [Clostridia bacterium]|nr:head-tail connector protein [Clostridia bacterium]